METNREDIELRLRDKAWLQMNKRAERLHWEETLWIWPEIPAGLRKAMFNRHLKIVRKEFEPAVTFG